MAAHFLGSDHRVTVKGLVVAGPGDLYRDVCETKALDGRLKEKIIWQGEISGLGKIGLQEAVSKAAAAMNNTSLQRERKVLSEFMGHIARDTGLYTIGAKEVCGAIAFGACERILLASPDPLQLMSIIVRPVKNGSVKTNGTSAATPSLSSASSASSFSASASSCTSSSTKKPGGGVPNGNQESKTNKTSPGRQEPCEQRCYHVPHSQVESTLQKLHRDKQSDQEIEVLPFMQYLVPLAEEQDVALELISDGTAEAQQFIKGFGGVGAILRYRWVPDDDEEEEDISKRQKSSRLSKGEAPLDDKTLKAAEQFDDSDWI